MKRYSRYIFMFNLAHASHLKFKHLQLQLFGPSSLSMYFEVYIESIILMFLWIHQSLIWSIYLFNMMSETETLLFQMEKEAKFEFSNLRVHLELKNVDIFFLGFGKGRLFCERRCRVQSRKIKGVWFLNPIQMRPYSLMLYADPFSMAPQKALETIGRTLNQQYERWQPRVRIFFYFFFLAVMLHLWDFHIFQWFMVFNSYLFSENIWFMLFRLATKSH